MRLEDLSPNEKDELLRRLTAGQAQEPQEEEEEFLDPIINIIQILVQKVQELEEKVEKLNAVVMDEIVGGITTVCKANKKFDGVQSLSSKYGEKFGPYLDGYKALEGSDDLWDKLYDYLEELKEAAGDEGEFSEESSVEEVFNRLKGMIDGVKGSGVKVMEVEATEQPLSEEEELIKEIKKMKNLK